MGARNVVRNRVEEGQMLLPACYPAAWSLETWREGLRRDEVCHPALSRSFLLELPSRVYLGCPKILAVGCPCMGESML